MKMRTTIIIYPFTKPVFSLNLESKVKKSRKERISWKGKRKYYFNEPKKKKKY
jgi:hypothetical protein